MEPSDSTLPINPRIEEPIALSEKQKELCRRLDDLHGQYEGLKALPSSMFKGALFLLHKESNKNPDWMSQAAHSLREVLYPIQSDRIPAVSGNGEAVFKEFGSVRVKPEVLQEVQRVYGLLNDLAHHGCNAKSGVDVSAYTKNEFENLLDDFERAMLTILDRQIDIHMQLDDLLSQAPPANQTHHDRYAGSER